ncbi:lipopolysaccharide N-acetylglucosaminyl transferase [Pandoraea sp. CB10b_02]|uniref:lipopolysaccharide N-acetylglucosaminyl transferase n=1 Tax=Pandoraea sp. CB10b_02 TaxID=2014535 RepID=UPI00257D7061|nr:lipopolysaccharide N-acetylglucosaminyl transferase [Pandoraea sp. CB10b_02]
MASRWHARRSGVTHCLRLVRWLTLLGGAALAIACQLRALELVLTAGDAVASGALPVVLAWQAVAAALAGLFMVRVLPARYRQRRGVFLHAALIVFFLPMAGLAVMLGVLLLGYLFPPPREAPEALRVSVPGFVSHLMARVRHGAGMRLRARLRNVRGERDDRVAALVSVQALPSRVTSGIARDLLADPVEEVRLLAYGILDGLEKRIMQQIFATRAWHEAAQDDDERAHAARRLAQLYWELVYQNLVRGEVLRYTLERVETFARDTLAQYEDDASMWYLLGRCALMREQPDAAQMYLRHAQFHSFPTERLLPWLAEAAFQKGRYDHVSQLLGGIGESAVTGAAVSPVVQPAVRFWTRP